VRIGIDARFLTHPQHGGFKTYTECLIEALDRVDPVNEYVLYVDRPPAQDAVLPRGGNFTVDPTAGDFPLIGMPWREQVRLARRAVRDRLDVFHSPCLSAPLRLPCPLVVTVHDMIWNAAYKGPCFGKHSARRRLMHLYYRKIPTLAIRKASAILTVSETSKREIVGAFRLRSERVVVTYEAVRPSFRVVADRARIEEARTRCELPPKYIFAMGAADPRKNLHTLITAFALLPEPLRREYPLVILLGHSALSSPLEQHAVSSGAADQVLMRRLSPTDEELALIFNAASLFAFPSLQEGFGLPPLEAMACGVPVVAARNSSIPEVLGDAALYAAADDPAGMAAAMARALSDEDMREFLRRKGLQRAARFSWDACARETVEVYQRVCGQKSSIHRGSAAAARK